MSISVAKEWISQRLSLSHFNDARATLSSPTGRTPVNEASMSGGAAARITHKLHIVANANHSLGLRQTTSSRFDFVPSASCIPGYVRGKNASVIKQPELLRHPSPSAAQCQSLCELYPKCIAAEFIHPKESKAALKRARKASKQLAPSPPLPPPTPGPRMGTCVLHQGCLERKRAPYPIRADVMHRWGPTWPRDMRPSSLEWKTNAVLVTVTYQASLRW